MPATSTLPASGSQKRAVRFASARISEYAERPISTCGVTVTWTRSRLRSSCQLAATRPATVTVWSPLCVSFSGWTSGGMIRVRSA